MGTSIKSAAPVIGPDGQCLTLDNLPPSTTKRWVMRRKAEVVAAVEGGLLSLSEACDRYRLTPEEFLEWEDAYRRYGISGLKISHPHSHLGRHPLAGTHLA